MSDRSHGPTCGKAEEHEAETAQAVVETGGLICPNCTNSILDHENNECVLSALASVLRDREGETYYEPDRSDGEEADERTWTHADTLRVWAKCDVDALWERLGPIIDSLQNGYFNTAKEPS